MILRRAKRRDANERRAKFVANREQVRSWTTRWECPQVEWPAFSEVPSTWLVRPEERDRWLDRDAPFMDEYRWSLKARPVAEGIDYLRATWAFGAGHEFECLTIRFRTVLDPGYLAEKLALGIKAAALKGWQDDDVHGLYDWLLEGVNQCDDNGVVSGDMRTGFLLCKMICATVSPTEVMTEVRVTLTDIGLNGAPLNANGRAQP